MEKFTTWLSRRRLVNILILLSYFLAAVLPHKRFGAFLNDVIFQGITRDEYNLFVLFASMIILSIFSVVFFRNSTHRNIKKRLWFYMAANVIFAVVILNMLFVINIEVIHYPQYALLAIFLFPVLGNYRSTMIWATIAGSIDEGYQYFYLAPNDTGYFDFNDVVTNTVGAAFGLVFLRSCGIVNRHTPRFYKSTAFYGLVFIIFSLAILIWSDVLSVYANDSASYHLVLQSPQKFWSVVHPNVTYHVVRPLEGIIITVLLWMFYDPIGAS